MRIEHCGKLEAHSTITIHFWTPQKQHCPFRTRCQQAWHLVKNGKLSLGSFARAKNYWQFGVQLSAVKIELFSDGGKRIVHNLRGSNSWSSFWRQHLQGDFFCQFFFLILFSRLVLLSSVDLWWKENVINAAFRAIAWLQTKHETNVELVDYKSVITMEWWENVRHKVSKTNNRKLTFLQLHQFQQNPQAMDLWSPQVHRLLYCHPQHPLHFPHNNQHHRCFLIFPRHIWYFFNDESKPVNHFSLQLISATPESTFCWKRSKVFKTRWRRFTKWKIPGKHSLLLNSNKQISNSMIVWKQALHLYHVHGQRIFSRISQIRRWITGKITI